MIKIKKDINLNRLTELGFEEVDFENPETKFHYANFWGDNDYNFENTYAYSLGYSRRGQSYYLLVDKTTRELMIYGTKPDGDPGRVHINNIFIRLYTEGFLEEAK